MNNVNIAVITRILSIWGATEEFISTFPDEILEEMQTITENETDSEVVFSKLTDLWDKAQIQVGIREVAESMLIPLQALTSIPVAVQQNIISAFRNGKSYEDIYNIFSNASAYGCIENVAAFLNVPLEQLEKLPAEKKETLCGYYTMFYQPDGDNSEIERIMKKIVNGE